MYVCTRAIFLFSSNEVLVTHLHVLASCRTKNGSAKKDVMAKATKSSRILPESQAYAVSKTTTTRARHKRTHIRVEQAASRAK